MNLAMCAAGIISQGCGATDVCNVSAVNEAQAEARDSNHDNGCRQGCSLVALLSKPD